MQPPFDISEAILALVIEIAEMLGRASVLQLDKPSPLLRRQNRIKTIQASLAIEGNSLTVDQVTAVLNQKRVVGTEKEIREVLNANTVYEHLPNYRAYESSDFLAAHAVLMAGLIAKPGKWRQGAVGVFKGEAIAHLAPPAHLVPTQMQSLFDWLKSSATHTLIKSCVAHYEIEFIHPFDDGNGRMGRLWQTVILAQDYPIFEFLPFETLIKERQTAYYEALEQCDKAGKSTQFIQFMLLAIRDTLADVLANERTFIAQTPAWRLSHFLEQPKAESFSRNDYLNVYKNLSTATASRDLQAGVAAGLIRRIGDKRSALYVRV